jgi:uncharacterized protein with PhoU and TrkA domain
MKTSEQDVYTALRRVYTAEGDIAYHIALFGDELANREGYKVHRRMDAVHFYLVQKYKWTPSVVKAMNVDDINFLLSEEMAGWKIPPSAR